jgi:hypothetical protein
VAKPSKKTETVSDVVGKPKRVASMANLAKTIDKPAEAPASVPPVIQEALKTAEPPKTIPHNPAKPEKAEKGYWKNKRGLRGMALTLYKLAAIKALDAFDTKIKFEEEQFVKFFTAQKHVDDMVAGNLLKRQDKFLSITRAGMDYLSAMAIGSEEVVEALGAAMRTGKYTPAKKGIHMVPSYSVGFVKI